jgi:hypothetical protein
MKTKRLLKLWVWVALSVLAPEVLGNAFAMEASPQSLEGGQALLAIETHRAAIVERLLADHAEGLSQRGLDAGAFRVALEALRADQLLAATLVSTLDEVLRIMREPMLATGPVGQRYVAITPTEALELRTVPDAQTYLVRDGEALSVVKAAELQLTGRNRVVGYFAPATSSVTLASTATAFTPKDGSGSGTGSWIGYTAGFNQATGLNSAVAAGSNNLASAQGAFVGAGTANQANGLSSLVIGGFDNRAVGIDSLVGAGAGHRATGSRSVIVGGGYNLASGGWSFIGGGGRDGTESTPAGTDARDHIASGNFSTIGGGQGNRTGPNPFGTVGGGQHNNASGFGATVAGGGFFGTSCSDPSTGGIRSCGNTASGQFAAVGGGDVNQASGTQSTVAGGGSNTASGAASTVAGGENNTASGATSTVAGGESNTASGNSSTVAGGILNTASGDSSFAAGRRAKALANGSVVFGDSTNADVTSSVPNQFIVAASGGIIMATNKNLSTGCFMVAGGGTWSCTSDRNAKRDFAPIAPETILHKVASLPLSMWRYEGEASGVRHIGPTAQDFRHTFGLGHDERTIALVDADGVALAAIQALHRLGQEKDARIVALEQRVAEVETVRGELAALKSALAEVLEERRVMVRRD